MYRRMFWCFLTLLVCLSKTLSYENLYYGEYYTPIPSSYVETKRDTDEQRMNDERYAIKFIEPIESRNSREREFVINSDHQAQPSHHRSFYPQEELISEITSSRHSQSELVFKVRRDPEGKLSVVVNDTVNIPHLPDYNPLPTYPVRRSTNVMKPTEPSRRLQSDFKFPEDSTEIDLKNVKPVCSSSKPDSPICASTLNYPKEYVHKALSAELDKYIELFGVDEIDSEIGQRIGADGEECLCNSNPNIIFPEAAQAKDNTWLFIVNHEKYRQGLRVEECSQPGKPCEKSELFPNGYTTECKQQYIYRNLLAYNGTKIIKELFKIPSCCKCILKSTRFNN